MGPAEDQDPPSKGVGGDGEELGGVSLKGASCSGHGGLQ